MRDAEGAFYAYVNCAGGHREDDTGRYRRPRRPGLCPLPARPRVRGGDPGIGLRAGAVLPHLLCHLPRHHRRSIAAIDKAVRPSADPHPTKDRRDTRQDQYRPTRRRRVAASQILVRHHPRGTGTKRSAELQDQADRQEHVLLRARYDGPVRARDNLMLQVAIHYAEAGDVILAAAGVRGSRNVRRRPRQRDEGQGPRGPGDGLRCPHATDLVELGLPVFSGSISIKGTVKETVGPINHPVVFGDEIIYPGDVLRGDADGVVVVGKTRSRKSSASRRNVTTPSANSACTRPAAPPLNCATSPRC